MRALPTPTPTMSAAGAPYWQAAGQGRLKIPWCGRCDEPFWYPRRHCPSCGSTDVSFRATSGLGTVYSYATVWRGSGAYGAAAPYVIAYVLLDQGICLATNLVDVEPERLCCDMPVEAVFDPVAEQPEGEPSLALVRFRPREIGFQEG